MTPDVHRIRRQRWVVRAGSPAEAFAIRQYLRERSPELIEPVLQAAFDAAVDPGTVLHLPKIELHVKVASLEEMATSLPERVARQLREVLPPRRAVTLRPDSATAGTTNPAPQARWEHLLHYLQTGLLTWDSAGGPPGDIAQRLGETCRELRSLLQDWLTTHAMPADVYARLILLLPADEVVGWAGTVSARLGPDRSAVVVALVRHLLDHATPGASPQARRKLAALVLQECHNGGGASEPPAIVPLLRRVLGTGEVAEFVAGCPAVVHAAIRQHESRRSTPVGGRGGPSGADAEAASVADHAAQPAAGAGSASSSLEQSVQAAAPAENRELPPSPERDVSSAGAVPEGEEDLKRAFADFKAGLSPAFRATPLPGQVADGPTGATAIPTGRSHPSKAGPREAIPSETTPPPHGRFPAVRETGTGSAGHPDLVPQAGLILLHPFLPRLFENLRVKDQMQPELRPGSLERAGAILHWLATGRAEVFEFELGFIKVLLGLTLRTPLHPAADLVTAEDREETESLLRSVIQHWTALRSTSPNGLRAAFLERAGLLTDAGDDWKLRLERRGFDVLVDQLPWSISVAKLPWMAKPIFTVW